MQLNEMWQKTYKFLASTQLAVGLFLIICVLAIPGTIFDFRAFYSNPFFVALLVLLGLNLILCTVRRFRSVSKPVLILHTGVLITLAGCVVTSFGYVATVNIYEGTSTNLVYRWDLGKDVPLGMELAVQRINRSFYPVPVKVGVMEGSEKKNLHTLKTGEAFSVPPYSIKAEELVMPGEVLKLSVFRDGKLIGKCDTAGNAINLPPDFPYKFKLVAYINPVLKRLWVDLQLTKGTMSTEGVSEINSPFQWGGIYFYNTQVARDQEGRSYAGIQVVKDPGRPYVFAGFFITSLGAVLCFARRFIRKR